MSAPQGLLSLLCFNYEVIYLFFLLKGYGGID